MNVCMSYENVTTWRINVSEGINISKSNESKECMFCHFGILKTLVLNFNLMDVIDTMICQWWSMI